MQWNRQWRSVGTFGAVLVLVAMGLTGCPLKDDPVKVSFWGTPRSGYADLTVQFYGSAEAVPPYTLVEEKFRDVNALELSIVGWYWDFGDGATGEGQNPTHVYTAPGRYTVTLTVELSDGSCVSLTRTYYIEVLEANEPPDADAGTDETHVVGDPVELDGTRSSDPDGDFLTYQWEVVQVPEGSSVTTASLSDPTAPRPTFTIDVPGTYVFLLTVSDGRETSTDTVIITTQNSAPVADAGPDQTAQVLDTVTLDGSGSYDVDGDALTYSWSFVSVPGNAPEKSSATLSDPTAVNPTFAIDLPGEYVLQLVVNDGEFDSDPDTVSITTVNSPPVADAGPDQTVHAGDTVALNGSGSYDVDGDALTYSWSFASVPETFSTRKSSAVLSDPTAVNPTFVTDYPGVYVVQLIVNDGTVDSAADTVAITTENTAPIADAGSDQSGVVTAEITLDGSGSYDPDGDAITYAWSFTSRPAGSTAALDDSAAVAPKFTIDVAGTYVLQLIVNDGLQDSTPDTVTVTTDNTPPVADAGPDQTAHRRDEITLDGTGSYDVDNDPLTYSWSLISVPGNGTKAPMSAATLDDPTSPTPKFTIDVPGVYVAQLIVNDGTVDSAPDTVSVTTENQPPVADAGPDQTVYADPEADPEWLYDTGVLYSLPHDPYYGEKQYLAALNLKTLDPETGDVLSNVPIRLPGTHWVVTGGRGLATHPVTGELWALLLVYLQSPDSQDVEKNGDDTLWLLARLDEETGIASPVGFLEGRWAGIAFTSDGELFGVTGSSQENEWPDSLYHLSQDDATATFWYQFTNSLDRDGQCLAFNFDDDEMYHASSRAYYKQPSDVILFESLLFVDPPVLTTHSVPQDWMECNPSALTYDRENGRFILADTCSMIYAVGPPTPDLVISDLSIDPTSPSDQDEITFTAVVSNWGSVDAGPFDVEFKIGGETFGLIQAYTGLAAGASETLQRFETLPAGSYGYSATADVNEDVDENNEYNNETTGAFTVGAVIKAGDGQVAVKQASDPDTYEVIYVYSTSDYHTSKGLAFKYRCRRAGTEVQLDGSGSYDPDSDPLTYAWTFVSVPQDSAVDDSSLSDATAVDPTFTPDLQGEYVVQLIVFDGEDYSVADEVAITYGNGAPVADAGPDQIHLVPSVVPNKVAPPTPDWDYVQLNGDDSYDLDCDTLTYLWTFTSVPDGSAVTDSSLFDPTAAQAKEADATTLPAPAFYPDMMGDYVLQLVVDDGVATKQQSAPDTVTVTVAPDVEMYCSFGYPYFTMGPTDDEILAYEIPDDAPEARGLFVQYRINCGEMDDAYTDAEGRVWATDDYYAAGSTYEDFTQPITGTDDPTLFQTERYWTAATPKQVPATLGGYSFPASEGAYVVRLHFAEIYDSITAQNPRSFDVYIEDTLVLDDYDIVADVGFGVAAVKEFAVDLTSAQTPTLDIMFAANEENPKISAIEVFSVAPQDQYLYFANYSPPAMGVYEVTNAQYASVLNYALYMNYLRPESAEKAAYAGGDVYFNDRLLLQIVDHLDEIEYCDIEYDAEGGGFVVVDRDGVSLDEHPVVEVSWYGAIAFCNCYSEKCGLGSFYSLAKSGAAFDAFPKATSSSLDGYWVAYEPEWEYFAAWAEIPQKATSPSGKHWIYGFTADDIDATRCNYNLSNPLGLSAEPLTTPVGYYDGLNAGTVFSMSPHGCFDMSGNVWEWTSSPATLYGDDYDPYYLNGSAKGDFTYDEKVIRGGSYAEGQYYQRTAYRTSEPPETTWPNLGFRVMGLCGRWDE